MLEATDRTKGVQARAKRRATVEQFVDEYSGPAEARVVGETASATVAVALTYLPEYNRWLGTLYPASEEFGAAPARWPVDTELLLTLPSGRAMALRVTAIKSAPFRVRVESPALRRV